MDFGFDVISAEEYERQRALYGPLTEALRKLIDAGLHTEVDEDTVREAQTAIEAVTGMLERKQRTVTSTLRHEGTGRPLAWANPAVGLRNAIAPPMIIHHEDDGRCWSEFNLSGAYEGPPGWVHGGICALVLDHILGEAASDGLTKPKFTGTISLRYMPARRSARCGPRHSSSASKASKPLRAAISRTPTVRRWRPKGFSSSRRGRGTPDEVLCQPGFSQNG